jgi:hypothetical protein
MKFIDFLTEASIVEKLKSITEIKHGISCQDNRCNHLNFNAIYRISYVNAIKAEPNDPAF